MRNICLTKEDLSIFVDHILYGEQGLSDELILQIDASKNWETEIQALNYFLSQLIQRKKNRQLLDPNFVSKVYEIAEVCLMGFSIEEIDRGFVEYMLSHEVSSGLDLNDFLFELKERLNSYDYAKYIRG